MWVAGWARQVQLRRKMRGDAAEAKPRPGGALAARAPAQRGQVRRVHGNVMTAVAAAGRGPSLQPGPEAGGAGACDIGLAPPVAAGCPPVPGVRGLLSCLFSVSFQSHCQKSCAITLAPMLRACGRI